MDQGSTTPAATPIGHPGIDDDSGKICAGCGEEFWPEANEAECEDCSYVTEQTEILAIIARDGDTDELLEQLNEMDRITDDLLIDQAIYYLGKNDADEAKLRIRLYTNPKFKSENECREKYEEAMAEKYARACA